MPSLLAYQEKFDRLPMHLTFGLACLIRFYKGEWKGNELPLNDDEAVIKKMNEIWQTETMHDVSKKSLENMDFWGEDLTKTPHLVSKIAFALQLIEAEGVEKAFKKFAAEFPSA